MMKINFRKVTESEITKAIADEFLTNLKELTKTQCIVVGAGPSGLMAAKTLAENGKKVVVIEQNNYLGGGFWVGGYLMNTLTFRVPTNEILDKIGIPYKRYNENLLITDGPLACSKLIASACQAGAKVLNLTVLDDIILKDRRVCGAVVNWMPVKSLPRQLTCMDPIALESLFVIDATGHDAVVASKLSKRNLLEIKGEGALNSEVEETIVENTKEVFPGLVVCGMAVSAVFGLPRTGPTFGAMLYSGIKAANIVMQSL